MQTQSGIQLINPDDLAYQPRAATTGPAIMAWSVPFQAEQSVHTGFAQWDDASAPEKTLDYNEFLLVLEGRFGVRLDNGREIIAQSGQLLFIPKGTRVQYLGHQAKVFFAISTPDSAGCA